MSSDFEHLGPYKVQRLLGRGGMGSVYLGNHAKSGEAVAIKVLAQAIANQPRFRRRFASEIDALKRLRHPNIVSLIGYGEEEGLLFYVMEYVAGQSVHDLIRTKKRLPWQDAVQIGIETSAALKHAHNIGIIHRDLKPANLLLEPEGTIKLTDFGIAKLYGAAGETAAGSVIGTADYMPPEQAEGKTITTRSDLYSLGCVLFALLTGKPPFHGKSLPEVLYAVRYNPTPDLGDLGVEAPDELKELVKQLLEKDPQRRPPTALVVGNRLKAIQQALRARPSLSGEAASSDPSPEERTQATQIGNRLTSVDMDDDDQPSGKERPTGLDDELADSPQGNETSSVRALGTHERQTVIAPQSRVTPGTPAGKGNPHESELSSEHFTPPKKTKSDRADATGASLVTSGGPSHYTEVIEDDSTSYTSVTDGVDTTDRWDKLQLASALGIFALLLASVAFVGWKLQPPSADQLYEKILLAAESGDDGELLSSGDSLVEFLRRFPDDKRASEVQALSDEVELIRRVRVLERKASRSSNMQELSAVELGFLDCMKTRSQNFSLGQEKLEALIRLYPTENLTPPDARLIELATFAKNANTTIVLNRESKATKQLDEAIQAAKESMSNEQLEQFYQHLLTLYDGNPWASEQVERIKRELSNE